MWQALQAADSFPELPVSVKLSSPRFEKAALSRVSLSSLSVNARVAEGDTAATSPPSTRLQCLLEEIEVISSSMAGSAFYLRLTGLRWHFGYSGARRKPWMEGGLSSSEKRAKNSTKMARKRRRAPRAQRRARPSTTNPSWRQSAAFTSSCRTSPQFSRVESGCKGSSVACYVTCAGTLQVPHAGAQPSVKHPSGVGSTDRGPHLRMPSLAFARSLAVPREGWGESPLHARGEAG